MKITAALASLHEIDADVLVLTLLEKKLSPLGNKVDKTLGGLLSQIIKKENFQGKVDSAKVINTLGKGYPVGATGRSPLPFDYLVLVGLGEVASKFHSDHLRRAASRAMQEAQKIRAGRLALEVPTECKRKFSTKELATAVTEGVLLGSYSFDRYKTKKEEKKTIASVEILADPKDLALVRDAIRQGEIVGKAIGMARDLINTPASDLPPHRLADIAKGLSLPGLSVKVLARREIERLGMEAFLAVAKGSVEPPFLIELHYKPKKKGKPGSGKVALVGKGVTFDSGGLSLKTPSSYMETMKDDMSGAAAVLAIMQALPALQYPVEVIGIIAATENMPSGSADKPGDIVRTRIGKTIEILNTDAEGRLTLAEAIPYALRHKPDLVIDMATLTGACVVALGELCAAIMGNDQKLVDRLITAGNETGERLWQLPLIEEYRGDIKSSIADLKNTGGKFAGTITAGLFLQEFVEPKTPWAHIDIAGPAWSEKDQPGTPRGGTGFMVRTILQFLRDL